MAAGGLYFITGLTDEGTCVGDLFMGMATPANIAACLPQCGIRQDIANLDVVALSTKHADKIQWRTRIPTQGMKTGGGVDVFNGSVKEDRPR